MQKIFSRAKKNNLRLTSSLSRIPGKEAWMQAKNSIWAWPLRLSLIFYGLVFSCCYYHPVFLYAGEEVVIRITEEAVLELKNGQLVSLADIKLSPDANNILQILILNKEIEIDLKTDSGGIMPQGNTSEPQPAYIFVKARHFALPTSQSTKPQVVKIFLNEWLLASGAAFVDAPLIPNDKNSRFLKLEEKARTSGQGIWSYDKVDKKQTGRG